MVTVSLTAASKEDAATVFDVLRTAFPTDLPSDAVPQEPGDHPAVWTSQFEPTQDRIPTGSTPPLEGSPTATLQGGHVAVDQLCEALSAAFAVHMQGTASGDQEQEVDLQLRTKR